MERIEKKVKDIARDAALRENQRAFVNDFIEELDKKAEVKQKKSI